MEKKHVPYMFRAVAFVLVIFLLAGLQRLLVPKYMGKVVEGAFVAEYYKDRTPHDVIILGDCEVYENISPVSLWRNEGIPSYIRGSAAQMITQSYYLLKETLRHEKPRVAVFSVAAMQQPFQSNETYNRMTLDGMRWSSDKLNAILASRTEGEHLIDYLFPLLRFHSRWQELNRDDLTYYFQKRKVSHNGYYLRADVRPLGDLPTERRRRSYDFDPLAWEYLDKIRMLCEAEGIHLLLIKAPSLYPAWYDEWDVQIQEYAEKYALNYLNLIEKADEIGLDFNRDTYDGGLHMNVYGAEKLSVYLGQYLKEQYQLPDRRSDAVFAEAWKEKAAYYDAMLREQEQEFAKYGYLRQFSEE